VDKTIEELTTAERHELLERHHFGRLGFLDQVGVMPMIIPVNYLMQLGRGSSAATRAAS
jgi:nitroimidazol reductase NimA-like FMN-containing flavoprotein (pyridoxamine 5'-phosphate oxidase superfamily)